MHILALSGSFGPGATPKAPFLDLQYFFLGDTLIDVIAVACLLVIGIALAVATCRKHMAR